MGVSRGIFSNVVMSADIEVCPEINPAPKTGSLSFYMRVCEPKHTPSCQVHASKEGVHTLEH